jgi:hypothetical protein
MVFVKLFDFPQLIRALIEEFSEGVIKDSKYTSTLT